MDSLELSDDDSRTDYEHAYSKLTEWLDDLQSGDEYYFEGESVGWQNASGSMTKELRDGEHLLAELCPSGSWNIVAEKSSEMISITLSHHDSPHGETHTIYAK